MDINGLQNRLEAIEAQLLELRQIQSNFARAEEVLALAETVATFISESE